MDAWPSVVHYIYIHDCICYEYCIYNVHGIPSLLSTVYSFTGIVKLGGQGGNAIDSGKFTLSPVMGNLGGAVDGEAVGKGSYMYLTKTGIPYTYCALQSNQDWDPLYLLCLAI